MSTPLERLTRDTAMLTLDEVDAFFARPGWALVVVTGDVSQRAEAQDLAVVTRELRARAPAGTSVGVLSTREEDAVKQRFSLAAVPALLFVKEGRVVSAVQRMQDWSVYTRAADVLWGTKKTPQAQPLESPGVTA
jgi:thioredoxin-like negative regulator of GroEL